MSIEELEYLISVAYKIYLYEECPIKRIFKGVTKAEYRRCKKIIEESKVKYKDVIAEKDWDYDYLWGRHFDIERGKANSVEDAVRLFDEEVRQFIRDYYGE